MEKLRILAVIAMLFLAAHTFSHGQTALSEYILEVNGVPCVADTASRTLYSTINLGAEQKITVGLAAGQAIIVDGAYIENGQKVLVNNFRAPLPITFVSSKKPKRRATPQTKSPQGNANWNVVFTTLPIISLHIDPEAEISKEISAPAALTVVDAQQRTAGQPVFRCQSAVHWRGATASTLEKKSYTVALQDATGAALNAGIFGISSDDKWILDAMAVDFSRMRNRLCFDIWNSISELADADMKRNGTVGYFVELVLNGKYQGLYCLSDKVNRKLLGLKKAKGKPDGSVGYRGLLYKCTRNDFSTRSLVLPDEDRPTDSTMWFDWDLEYPDEHPAPEAWQPLTDLMRFTGSAAESPEEVDERLYEHFYEGNAVTYPVFMLACMLTDNMMHNSYLSVRDLTRDARFWITPWDLDASFARDGWGNRLANYADSWNVFQGAQPFHSLFAKRDSRFFNEMAMRWKELRDGPLSVETVCGRIQAYADLLDQSGAWQRERLRWNGHIRMNGNGIDLDESAQDEAEYMKSWYASNYEHLQHMFSPAINGIEDFPLSRPQRPQGIFTIDGRRVPGVTSPGQLAPGIYIIDGHKVVR